MKEINKDRFVGSTLWKVLEQFSTKGVSMLVSIILMRLLLPEDFGLLALTAVFVNLSDILIDGGFGTALVRKREVDDCDYSSVFLISVVIATVLYLVIFFSAPFFSAYYEAPMLIPVMRVIGISLFIQAASSVRTAIVTRNMQFRLLFRCNLFSTILSGVLGILAAYMKLGVWAIVLQRLLQQFFLTIFLLRTLKWKMTWSIQLARVREMLGFSFGVVGSSLINYASGSLWSLVIGKCYSVETLGYSDKGNQLPSQVSLYTFGSMTSVLLPTLASFQGDTERIKRVLRKVIQMTAFLILPMMTGLAIVSQEIVILLFTEKWLPCVPLMKMSCVYYAATPFTLIFIQTFFALGRSDLRVKTELFRGALMMLGITVFALIIRCDIIFISAVSALIAVVSALATFIPMKKLIGFRWTDLFLDLWKYAVSTVIMCAVLFTVQYIWAGTFEKSIWLSLLIKILIGVATYIFASLVLKVDAFAQLVQIIKDKLPASGRAC